MAQSESWGPYVLGPNASDPSYGVYVGDMRQLCQEIPDGSIDLVFTDPPYDQDSVPLYGQLARISARVLKAGGICATYVGKMYLDRILGLMVPHLPYWHMCALYQPGGGRYLYPVQMAEAWRPVLVMRKGAGGSSGRSGGSGDDGGIGDLPRWARDAYQGTGREKDTHEWQQETLPAVKYISAWTEQGDVVLDPFCGGATFPAVAKALNRYYLAFEIDEGVAVDGRRRIRSFDAAAISEMALGEIGPSAEAASVATTATTLGEDFSFDVLSWQT